MRGMETWSIPLMPFPEVKQFRFSGEKIAGSVAGDSGSWYSCRTFATASVSNP